MQTLIQLIKRVNNTEIGAGNTNEFYILVPTELDISEMMPINNECEFICRKNPVQHYKFRFTQGREKRIVGMGDFYRDNAIEGGDEIILEYFVDNSSKKHYVVDFKKRPNSIVMQKFKDGFEALSPNKLNLINTNTKNESGQPIEISFINEFAKRSDSPQKTKCYAIKINGDPISNRRESSWVEIIVKNQIATIKPIITWKILKFKQ